MFITKLLRQFSHGRITEVMPVGRTKSCGATRESSILSFGTSSFCNFSFRKKAEAVLLSAFVQSLAIPHKTRLAGPLRGPRRLLTVSESLQSISYALSCKATLYPTKNPLLAGPIGSGCVKICSFWSARWKDDNLSASGGSLSSGATHTHQAKYLVYLLDTRQGGFLYSFHETSRSKTT